MSAVSRMILLVMLASQYSPASAVIDDGTENLHQRVRYNNVFFSEPLHMKGRPSTSYVMVKSEDGRAYQLSNSGNSYTYSGRGDQDIRVHHNVHGHSTCPNMTPKPSSMCVNTTNTCWSVGQQDLDCLNSELCCFDGCANTCTTRVLDPRVIVTGDTCPVVETKTEEECEGSVANCWSRGVPDVDCPNFGLCCYDGCVNTCKLSNETDLVDQEADEEYDESLADALEDPDEEYDESLDDELDDSASDDLTDVDEYGAPAAPVLDNIDSYGSPLADTIDNIDSYGSPAADPISGYIPEKTRQFPSKLYSRQSTKSVAILAPSINPGINSLSSRNIRGLNSIVLNDKHKINKNYYKQNPNVVSPWHGITQQHLKFRNQEANRLSRKKLMLSERKKVRTEDVLKSLLHTLWKKHIGVVFANF